MSANHRVRKTEAVHFHLAGMKGRNAQPCIITSNTKRNEKNVPGKDHGNVPGNFQLFQKKKKKIEISV